MRRRIARWMRVQADRLDPPPVTNYTITLNPPKIWGTWSTHD